MFYHPNDNKFTITLRHSIFWIALASMFVMFLIFLGDDVMIPQKEVSLKIDVKNKVNICLPEDKNFDKGSFFGF